MEELFEENSEIIQTDTTCLEFEYASKDHRFHFAVSFILNDGINLTAFQKLLEVQMMHGYCTSSVLYCGKIRLPLQNNI